MQQCRDSKATPGKGKNAETLVMEFYSGSVSLWEFHAVSSVRAAERHQYFVRQRTWQSKVREVVKAIAEELRGLAVETNVPIMSATQTTRTGYTSTDIGLEDTSESFGLPATADLMFALISSEELEDLNQIVVKQLKNRYNDPTMNKRFVLGIDRAKMRLYDCEQEAQEDLVDSGQDRNVFDNTPFAGKSKGYEKFSDLKV